MGDPRISVVIPTYNSRHFVGRAITSSLGQTLPPAEIIVIDDGSTDGTREFIQKEFGDRVVYLYQDNQGEGAARNAGIQASSGEWLSFLDADDWWVPEKLELQMAQIEKYPTASMVACGASYCSLDGEEMSQIHLPKPFTARTIREGLKLHSIFPVSTLVRREVFDRVGGFAEGLPLGADREMWARVAAQYEVVGVDEPLLKITDHPASMSSDPERIIYYGPVVNRKVLKTLGSSSTVERLKDRLILRKADAEMYQSAAYLYIQRGEDVRAAQNVIRSLSRWPMPRARVYRLALRMCMRLAMGGFKSIGSREQIR